jgi:ABC transport system ATP-binding/permease protein
VTQHQAFLQRLVTRIIELDQEEAWIRRGVEAHRTHNEGRVRDLQRLRELRRERREQPAKVRLQMQEAKRSGRLVIEAEAGLVYSERYRAASWSSDN